MHEKGAPFRLDSSNGKLGRFTEVFRLDKEDRYLVKRIIPDQVEKYYGRPIDLAEVAKKLKHYLDIIFEIQQQRQLDIFPTTDAVIGENPQQEETIYMAQEKINGVSLNEDEVAKLSPEQRSQLRCIIEVIIDTYIRTYSQETHTGMMVEPAKISNYLLGNINHHVSGNSKIYYIDFFPVFDYDPTDVQERLKAFAYTFGFSEIEFKEQTRQLQQLS